MSVRCFSLVLLLTCLKAVADPVPPAPVYVDDERHFQALEAAIQKHAHDGKAVRGRELLGQVAKRKQCNIAPAPPSAAQLKPEEVYSGCIGGVVAITSAWKDEGNWTVGDPATAWVLTPDGVLVTNYHIFADAEKEEVFGVLTQDGRYFPVTEILAADTVNDVAVFRVPAKGLQPLALAQPEPVGKLVCIISHPDSQFYTYTQGLVSRYTLQRDHPKDPLVKYMSVTAEFARGSSGGPVLNEHGAVVGMVCSTRTVYYGQKGKDKDDDVQMVIKYCIPADSIRQLLKPVAKDAGEQPKAPGDLPPSSPNPAPVPETPVPGPPGPAPVPPKATPVPEP